MLNLVGHYRAEFPKRVTLRRQVSHTPFANAQHQQGRECQRGFISLVGEPTRYCSRTTPTRAEAQHQQGRRAELVSSRATPTRARGGGAGAIALMLADNTNKGKGLKAQVEISGVQAGRLNQISVGTLAPEGGYRPAHAHRLNLALLFFLC